MISIARDRLEEFFRSLKPEEMREFRKHYLGIPQEDFAYALLSERSTAYRWESPRNHSVPSSQSAYFVVEKFGDQLRKFYRDKQRLGVIE